ncbi:GntR family transcriptional regulator [Cohnella nanjingensis]|uniref:GntR family transcriptional regulator n=1 Tax=Cohnella nanjingensis TaxID=1387779 RepID=A0A7X0RVJ8_9BACL|nr:GntR family transcriptional regulator [Cohnella nanjingensis]MBB6674457.1 GntR family transcriptional regulator [Cohnella nanjingensis]
MWIPIQIDENRPEPLYHQIEVQLRGLILGGQLAEGTLLPSIREFASHLRCSAITVRRVYQDLENEGLLRTRQGTGTFVAGVDAAARAGHRLERVVEAFERAVETGLQLQCTLEEMEQILQDVYARRTTATKGDSP